MNRTSKPDLQLGRQAQPDRYELVDPHTIDIAHGSDQLQPTSHGAGNAIALQCASPVTARAAPGRLTAGTEEERTSSEMLTINVQIPAGSGPMSRVGKSTMTPHASPSHPIHAGSSARRAESLGLPRAATHSHRRQQRPQ